MQKRPETIDQKIRRYIPLMHHIGKSYRCKMQPDDYDDAVTEAMCAIQRGIETYDNRVKVKLDTYVGTCIRNAFNGFVKSLYSGQEGFESGCVAFSDVFPDGNLPVDSCELNGYEIEDEAETGCVAFSDVFPDGNLPVDSCELNGYEIEDEVETELIRRMVSEHPPTTKRERDIVQMRLRGYLFVEIGEAYGISFQRAAQIYNAAVEKIKEYWDR